MHHSIASLPGRLTRFRATGLVLGALAALVLATAPGTVGAQTAAYTGDLPPAGGVALLMAAQDNAPDALADALRGDGCEPTSISVTQDGAWLVFVPGAPEFVNAAFPASVSSGTGFVVLCRASSGEATAQDAVEVLETYFALLDAGDHEAAYALWRHAPDDQTLEEFTAGFADTASVTAEVGEPGRIDAGAGQRYIPVPVTITSTLTDGTTQTFEGDIVLHRTADIPGSTPDQREWRLHTADLTQVS